MSNFHDNQLLFEQSSRKSSINCDSTAYSLYPSISAKTQRYDVESICSRHTEIHNPRFSSSLHNDSTSQRSISKDKDNPIFYKQFDGGSKTPIYTNISRDNLLISKQSLNNSNYNSLKNALESKPGGYRKNTEIMRNFKIEHITPTRFQLKIANIFDYSISLLKHTYNKLWRNYEGFQKPILYKFQSHLQSLLRCRLNITSADLLLYSDIQTKKIFSVEKVKKEVTNNINILRKNTEAKQNILKKDSNVRKKLKLMFNSKILSLLDIFILLITNGKFKSFPQIMHNDPHKKNNIKLFDSILFEVILKNECSLKRSLKTLFNKRDILQSLLLFDKEIASEKLILFELLKAFLHSKYGKLVNLFFNSDFFIHREKFDNSAVEKKYEELGKDMHRYFSSENG